MGITPIATAVGGQLSAGVANLVPLVFSGEFLEWAVIFFVIAIVAALLGARGVAGVTMAVAKWFVIIFLALAVISIIL